MGEIWLNLLGCIDYWLERYQTLLVGLGAIYVALEQVKLMKGQETIMAKQQQFTEAQGRASIRGALGSILPMLDPGTGHFSAIHRPHHGPVVDLKINMSKDEFTSAAAVGYPDYVDAFANFYEAVDEYQKSVEALPDDVRDTPQAHSIWMVPEDATPEGKVYMAAFEKVVRIAGPIRHAFNLEDIDLQGAE